MDSAPLPRPSRLGALDARTTFLLLFGGIWVLVGAINFTVFTFSQHQNSADGRMPRDNVKVLEPSTDPKELLAAAIEMAQSADPADHDRLVKHLENTAFLGRLDTEADYQRAARFKLRVARVVDALAKNPAPSARTALLTLAKSKPFLEDDERTVALIEASAGIVPPPPELVAFWDAHSQPDDGFTPTTVSVLADNGSPPAVALLEKKLADPHHGEGEKLGWMRTRILTHRTDRPLLEACERMLRGSLPAHLRPALVDVLFDYRPDKWYKPATVVSPPDLRSASPEALRELRRVADTARKVGHLTHAQTTAIDRTVEEITKLLP